MSQSHTYYRREFKQEAAQLLQTSGATQAEVARNLGVTESSLWRWVK